MKIIKSKFRMIFLNKKHLMKIITLILFIILLFTNFSPEKIINFNSAMSGCLSFSSISSSLLFGSFSFINYSSDKANKIIKSMNADIKIMNNLLLSAAILFFVSILSLFELIFFKNNSNNIISIFITSLWLALLLYGILYVFYVFKIIFSYLSLKRKSR